MSTPSDDGQNSEDELDEGNRTPSEVGEIQNPTDLKAELGNYRAAAQVLYTLGGNRLGMQWFLTKPRAWRRDLIRKPWLFPIAAMHLAATEIQKAWRPCWLRGAKPNSRGYGKSASHPERARPVSTQSENPFTSTLSMQIDRKRLKGNAKEARCLAVRETLQQRYLDLLKNQYTKSTVHTDEEAAKLIRYPSYEHFVAAVMQGFFRNRRMADTRILWRVIRYKRVGLYHVAAFEIQSAWRMAVQRWETQLMHQEQIRKQGLSQVAHARVYAATKIQQAWRNISNYRIYYALRDIVAQFRGTGDPYLLLRSILPREAMLLDPAMQTHVRFRLGGMRFPPSIYYKIFTHGAVCDIGSFAPRSYAAERKGTPRRAEDYYVRCENNGWRPLISRLQPGGDNTRLDEVEKTTSRKVIKSFHHSRLRRQQDVQRARKQRSVAWMQKMYSMVNDGEEVSFPPSPCSIAAGAPSASGGAARLAREGDRILETQMTPRPPPMPPKGRPRPGNSKAPARTSKFVSNDYHSQDTGHVDINQSGRQDDMLMEDLNDDVLLEWSKKLDFDAYMDSWGAIATSDCSEGALPIGQLEPMHRTAPHAMIARVH